MASSTTPPVLIIGAGIGGLALAHGLRGAGIPFHVYERDPSPTFRAQGYRVRISPEGAEALHGVLSSARWSAFEQRCAESPRGMSTIDAITGKSHETTHKPMIHRPQRANFSSYTADRIETRAVLLEELDPHVTFGRDLQSFEVTADGVTATFVDGSKVIGSLLVGADGVRSKVRRQHFVAQAPVDTQARAIYGKTPLTPEVKSAAANDLLSKACLVQDRSGSRGVGVVTLFAEAVRFPANGSPHPVDYFYWVLIAHRDAFISDDNSREDDIVPRLSKHEAKALSLHVTSHWDSTVSALLEHQDTSQAAGLRICSAVPANFTWGSSPRVTAIGDAIHVAPPAGGQGANLAIKDAWMLTEALKEYGVGEDAIGVYESSMREYAAKAVQASLGGGKWMFDQLEYDQCDIAAF